jgi:rhamnosyltransferase
VDNTPAGSAEDGAGLRLDPEVAYLPNGRNVGIATALNQGIAQLIADGCAFAMLFDQDSEPTKALIGELVSVLRASEQRHERVAVAGPAYEDARLRGVAPFVRFGYFRLKRIMPVGEVPLDVDFLITSGSCINLACWNDVGPMDDALFIDLVDTEWCMRARARGYRVLGVPWVRSSHELGGKPIRAFGRNYPMHSAVRHYYLFRNVIALFKRGYVPCTWKSTEIVKLPARLLIYMLFIPDARTHVRLALRGVWHGLAGRMGML